MRTITVILTDEAETEMEELSEQYAVPMDALAQKFVIDVVHEVYEQRVLDHKRKRAEVK